MIKKQENTALIYCENQFGQSDGKTAVGLIRHSEIYQIVGVIDSSLNGKDSGEELGIGRNNIPIFKDLSDAIQKLLYTPDYYIYGKAPIDTHINKEERSLIIEAMKEGMSVINGLHQFFSEDKEFYNVAKESNIKILDTRKPPALEKLNVFNGKISTVNIPVIAVLGTDCACGKMTTARALNEELNNANIKSILIATGQTALIQGSKYGVAIDAIPSQFVIGEIENSIVQAFEKEKPDIILVEGQSSLGHEAFMGSMAILKGSCPDGIILQHIPGREHRVDFPNLEMPTLESELYLIDALTNAEVLMITLSHEELSADAIFETIEEYEEQFKLPVVDVLLQGCQLAMDVLVSKFPEIKNIKEKGV